MSIQEQKQIAFDMGRLAAWRGQSHHEPYFRRDPMLFAEWERGVAAQCKIMSDAAGKVPLLFADEKAKN